jgi:hypothetical protein
MGPSGGCLAWQFFKKKYQPDSVLLVGSGGLPWDEFLQIDPGDLF